jgi:hypothetical protein
LAASGSNASLLLLRLKARLGDSVPEVTGECFLGLMQQDPKESAPFVAEFLEAENDAIVETALVALGNSRRAEAFEVLKAFWQQRPPNDVRETTLLAMALLRFSAATDFLLALLADAPEATALLALSALTVLNYDRRVRETVAEVVNRRNNDVLRTEFIKKFLTDP